MAIFQQTRNGTSGTVPETAIGAFVKISGHLTSDGDVRFDGILENGGIDVKGCLTVGETSTVSAEVKAEKLVLLGTIDGNVTTEGDVEIGASGKLQGDLNAGGNLIIHPGGVFIGKSMMVGKKSVDATEKDVVDTESESASSKR